MFSFMHEYSSGLVVSAAAHALLLLALSVSLLSAPPRATLQQLAIEATLVDEGAMQRAQEQREQQARLEQQRLEEQRRRETEAEQRRKDQAEQARLQRLRLEEKTQQQAAAERQRREQDERDRLARIEQERQAEEVRLRQAEEARLRAGREAELRVAMQAEERLMAAEQAGLMAAEQAGLLAQYIAVIRQKVERNWVRPNSANAGLECVVHVTQIPGGEVVGVRLGECNGDEVVVRSIEAAVYRSSPLPLPPDPELFERNLRFTFKPEQ
jgi:colicin import membrane protein